MNLSIAHTAMIATAGIAGGGLGTLAVRRSDESEAKTIATTALAGGGLTAGGAFASSHVGHGGRLGALVGGAAGAGLLLGSLVESARNDW